YILSIGNYLNENHKQTEIEQARFGRLIELSWDEIYVFDNDTLRFNQVNTGALDNLGYSKDEINQLKITDLLQDISENTFHRLTLSLSEGNRSQVVLESVFKRKDNTEYPVEIRIQLSHSEVPPVYLANVQNITERK
ncbi:MAG: PAS domain S-box protein, partial [Gammaproteobacteria bacterium]|nr:PAS domain S-box protein [Gammaproteobacteria bacterium]